MDKSKIPYGMYCYGRGGRSDKCPYWEYIETIIFYKDSKNNCDSYDKCEDNDKCGTSFRTSCKVDVIKCNYLNLIDKDEKTLLWDQVKECGINEWEDE